MQHELLKWSGYFSWGTSTSKRLNIHVSESSVENMQVKGKTNEDGDIICPHCKKAFNEDDEPSVLLI